MKVELRKIVVSYPIVDKFFGLQGWNVYASFSISSLLNSLKPHHDAFEKARVDYIRAHGEEKEEGSGDYQLKPEKFEEFNNEMTELLKQEIELNIPKLEINKILENSNVETTPSDFSSLLWIFEENSVEEEVV